MGAPDIVGGCFGLVLIGGRSALYLGGCIIVYFGLIRHYLSGVYKLSSIVQNGSCLCFACIGFVRD